MLCPASLPVLGATANGMGAVPGPLRAVDGSRCGRGGAFLEGSFCLGMVAGEGGFAA